MGMTLLTAAYVMRAVYDGAKWLPEGFELAERYDAGTVQGSIYLDSRRGKIGFGVQGTNREPSWWADWARNFDIRRVAVDGHQVAAGWWRGAEPLIDWLHQRGVSEVVGHSKGSSEGILAAWQLKRRYGGRIQTIALANPKPFYGTPPLMDALCVRNPDDVICRLPPFPGWRSPGTTIILPWEAPDLAEDHRLDKLIPALLRSGHGYLALTDQEGDEPAVTRKASRGAVLATGWAEPPMLQVDWPTGTSPRP